MAPLSVSGYRFVRGYHQRLSLSLYLLRYWFYCTSNNLGRAVLYRQV